MVKQQTLRKCLVTIDGVDHIIGDYETILTIGTIYGHKVEMHEATVTLEVKPPVVGFILKDGRRLIFKCPQSVID